MYVHRYFFALELEASSEAYGIIGILAKGLQARESHDTKSMRLETYKYIARTSLLATSYSII
jgi:hypothetical protein